MRPILKGSRVRLCIVPALIGLVGLILMSRMYPIHINSNIGFGQDPAYQYLFAAVDILQGNAPLHTDHPGTPLQTLIASILVITWLCLKLSGATSFGLFESVLRSPELFLGATSLVLLSLTVWASFYYGRRVYQTTLSYASAAACQVMPLLFSAVMPNVVYPTPEALLVAISLVLMGVLAPVVLSRGTTREQACASVANWTGVLCGLGLAVKVTFAPMLGLMLLLKSPRLIFQACCICVLAWFIGVLPILPRLGTMFQWFYSLLVHTGIHGGGANAVFDFGQLKLGLGWLISHFGVFYYSATLILGLLLLGLLLKALQRRPAPRAQLERAADTLQRLSLRAIHPDELLTSLVLLLVCFTQTLMVAKHLGPAYMVPALALSLLGVAWVLQSQQVLFLPAALRNKLTLGWLGLTLVFATISVTSAATTLQQNQQKGLQTYATIEGAIKQFNDPLLLGAFNCNFAECAIWFGMTLVPAMEFKMTSVTPNFYYFDIFNKKLHLPGKGELNDKQTFETLEQLAQYQRPVLLISPGFPHLSHLRLELVVSTPVQNLYRVLGAAGSPPP